MAATSPEILSETEISGATRGLDQGHIAALTGLRGFAAIVVVLVHGSGLTGYPWVGLHGYGPIALFTLSGFLLFQPWSRWILGVGRRPSLITFFRRRFWRIFPAYLVVMFFVVVVYPPARPDGVRQWLHAMTLTSIYDPAGRLPGLEHTWSLGTEVTWYVALPVIGFLTWAVVRRKILGPVVAVVVVFALAVVTTAAWRWMVGFQIDDYGQRVMYPTWLPAYIACFMGGAVIGHIVIAKRNGLAPARALIWLGSKPWVVLAVALGAALLGNSPLGGPWTFAPASFTQVTFRMVMCTIAALVLLAGVAAASPGSFVTRLFALTWLEAIGRWSYGIYLWHMPLVALAWQHRVLQYDGVGFLVWLTCLVAVSTALGAATYSFVERPAIGWSKRGSLPARVSAPHR